MIYGSGLVKDNGTVASHAALGITLRIKKKSSRRKHLIKVEKDKARQEN